VHPGGLLLRGEIAGKAKHQERQEALGRLGKDLARRARRSVVPLPCSACWLALHRRWECPDRTVYTSHGTSMRKVCERSPLTFPPSPLREWTWTRTGGCGAAVSVSCAPVRAPSCSRRTRMRVRYAHALPPSACRVRVRASPLANKRRKNPGGTHTHTRATAQSGGGAAAVRALHGAGAARL